MKTKTRKVLRIVLLTLLLAVTALLTFTACSWQLPVDKEIIDAEVLGIPENGISIGGFNEANIQVKVMFDDGSAETTQLLESDLPEEYQALLNVPGEYTFEMLYRGMKISYRLVVNGEVYKVTFLNALDQVVKSIDYEMYTGLPKITPPTAEEMEVPGYRFLGEFDKSWDNITGDTVIKGVYVKTYVVSFYNGIDVEPISTQVLDAGEDAIEPSEEDRYVEGYFFKGWDRDFTNVQSDLNVNGFYIRGYIFEYDIENMDDNWYWHDCGYISGSVESGTCVAPGTKITLSVEPNCGYAFLGWYLDDMLVSEDPEYTFLMLTQDVTLVARVAKDHECVDSGDFMDHLCDICGEDMSCCVDADPLDHYCDICGLTVGKHADYDRDHCCDYGCAVKDFGACEDADFDHACDYGCDEEIGPHEDCDMDHLCDYCGGELSVCQDADKDHFCDICDVVVYAVHADGEIVDHHCDYCGEALSECVDVDPEDHFCDICGAVIDGNGMCVDADKDHCCDICDEPLTECADYDKDHYCDICDEPLAECVDEWPKDHFCDYGCGATYGVCADADMDHQCDYGCGYFFGEHCDANMDHLCDYGCQIIIGWHGDSDWDHRCDFCDALLTYCEDYDRDHRCDICGAEMGKCVDADIDHRCDYGCGAMIGEHADSEDDNDHYCDYCAMLYDFNYGMRLEECFDLDKNHFCDVCGYAIGVHADSEGDNDHYCDYCVGLMTECVDADKGHHCDECGEKLSDCADEDEDHFCDYCGETLSACDDADDDHLCDVCGAELTVCDDANKNHFCDLCGASMGTCADGDKDHYCDYGCDEIFGGCEDTDKDHYCDICDKPVVADQHAEGDYVDHKCDYCGEKIGDCVDADSDHTCDICGLPVGEHLDSEDDNDHYCDYCGKAIN